MPTRPLPKNLVERLRRLHGKKAKKFSGQQNIRKFVGRLNNVDIRVNAYIQPPIRDITNYSRRIRELDVSKNFPKVKKVIIKAHHREAGIINSRNAQEAIESIRAVVKHYNSIYKNEAFAIKLPHAYNIGENYIAMTKSKYPTLDEMIGHVNRRNITKKGEEFLAKLRKQHPNLQLTEAKLHGIAKLIHDRTRKFGDVELWADHLFCTGVRNGKLTFVPLIDLF